MMRTLLDEVKELREQVATLQKVIDESNEALDFAEVPSGNLSSRITDLVSSKKVSIPKKRMLQVIHRVQQKKRERYKYQ